MVSNYMIWWSSVPEFLRRYKNKEEERVYKIFMKAIYNLDLQELGDGFLPLPAAHDSLMPFSLATHDMAQQLDDGLAHFQRPTRAACGQIHLLISAFSASSSSSTTAQRPSSAAHESGVRPYLPS